MSTGRYKDRVEILRPTIVQDASGDTRTYAVVSEAFVWIRPLRASEFQQVRQVVAEATNVIEGHARALEDVQPEWRIRKCQDGREFDLGPPLQASQGDRTAITAIERF